MNARPTILTLLTLCATLTACGYRLGPATPGLTMPVAVPLVDNQTAEPELTSGCTEALVAQLRSEGATVGDRQDAGVVIEGVVRSVEERVVAFGDTTAARSAQVEVTVVVQLFVTREGQPVAEVRDVSGASAYARSGDPLEVSTRQRVAQREACGEAMANATVGLMDVLAGGEDHGEGK